MEEAVGRANSGDENGGSAALELGLSGSLDDIFLGGEKEAVGVSIRYGKNLTGTSQDREGG